jgi:predicted nucleic acid-binding protein
MPTGGESVLVSDASALAALLLDAGPAGAWVSDRLRGASLAAPSLVRWETANIIRRHELGDLISSDQAAQAHMDLLDLEIELWPYELLATRCWDHRHNLSIYDAGYVALAELVCGTLVTLDRRIARAPGIACALSTPDS